MLRLPPRREHLADRLADHRRIRREGPFPRGLANARGPAPDPAPGLRERLGRLLGRQDDRETLPHLALWAPDLRGILGPDLVANHVGDAEFSRAQIVGFACGHYASRHQRAAVSSNSTA